MAANRPRLVLNVDALAVGERYVMSSACNKLVVALARSKRFSVVFATEAQNVQAGCEYLLSQGVAEPVVPISARSSGETEVVLSLGGVSPSVWRDDPFVLRAQLVGDLAPLANVGSFSPEAVEHAQAMVRDLDPRTAVLVLTEHAKELLLQRRPDLSPAQTTVIKAEDWDRNASFVEDALLDAYKRYSMRPVSMLWQYPGAGSMDPSRPASFLGFANGAAGPNFGLAPRISSSAWPRWSDTLPTRANARIEGGARTRGEFKSGAPGEPLVSYITVVRNNVKTLGRAIESVRRQTYRNVEHIIVDGASTDGTVDLIQQHAERLDYFASEADAGLYDAINKAVALARGDLICVLNSDDWLEPHAAEIAVRRMRGRLESAALLATGAVIYNLQGNVEVEWPPTFVHPGSYFACANICHNGVYATRAAYERSGPYDATFRIAADTKWVLACLDAGVEFAYTREVSVNYSLGGTSGDARAHSKECQRLVAERFPFLTKEEILGLYDCYFLFERQPHDEPVHRTEASTMFLQRVMVDHTDCHEFLIALAWAAASKLVHPHDVQAPAANAAPAVPPSVVQLAREGLKLFRHRYPRLYAAARKGYVRLRR